jgi:hypothetical protein
MREEELRDLDALLAGWRRYIAVQQGKPVQETSPGYLAGLRVCADQLEFALERIKQND